MRVLTLIISCLMAACARPDYAEARPDFLLIAAGAQPGYGIKPVVRKENPITLVADDGSVCRTSAERFADITVGKWIACAWILPS